MAKFITNLRLSVCHVRSFTPIKLRHLGDSPPEQVWDLKHWTPFFEAFGRFDPEGRGEMLASDVSVVNISPLPKEGLQILDGGMMRSYLFVPSGYQLRPY